MALVPLLSACGGEPSPPAAAAVTRPVKTLVIADGTAGGERSFPARIAAAQSAALAFRVSGTVARLAVREGDRLQEGATVAELDPKDFQIVVSDRQATFDNAKKNFDRAQDLVASGAISRMDFDRLEAEFKNARAALDAARQDLAYTKLSAPFAGVVARRHVEQFEQVQVNQAIVTLQNLDRLEVKFDVPESLIRGIRAREDREAGRDDITVVASFEDLPGQRLPLRFKEAAAQADAQTQTFEVTYTMDRVAERTVLPGMTATVTVDLSRLVNTSTSFMVPVSAVVGDYKLDPQVWVVEPESMTTRAQAVEVGRMSGDRIEVTAGLEPGMRIVTAGASFVTPGMQVTLMPEREQAEPRASDAL
jgi:RND family efflux transporter MFP subunit